MKITFAVLVVAILSLTSCSTAKRGSKKSSAKSSPETVFITYHVIPGKEAQMKDVLSRAWEIYPQERLVFASPHVIVQTTENGGPRFMEIFTWVNHDAPDRPPASVKTVWKEMHTFCEARDGRGVLEGGEVGLVTPKPK